MPNRSTALHAALLAADRAESGSDRLPGHIAFPMVFGVSALLWLVIGAGVHWLIG